MNPSTRWQGAVIVLIVVTFLIGGVFVVGNQGLATDKKAKMIEHQKAHALFVQKCLGCHVSVADPEKPGRTRDDWHLIVNVMHDYGLDLTEQESEMLIELLYDLRRGMEREAG